MKKLPLILIAIVASAMLVSMWPRHPHLEPIEESSIEQQFTNNVNKGWPEPVWEIWNEGESGEYRSVVIYEMFMGSESLVSRVASDGCLSEEYICSLIAAGYASEAEHLMNHCATKWFEE